MPKFHNFQEAMDCIEAGGAAYLYGNPYPVYFKSNDKIIYEVDPDKKNYYYIGSSSNTLSNTLNSYNYIPLPPTPPLFDVQKQLSVSWVLIAPDEWKKQHDEKAQKAKELSEAHRREYEEFLAKQTVTQSNNETQWEKTTIHYDKTKFADWFIPIWESTFTKLNKK